MKETLFSSDSEKKLKEHTKTLFYEKRKDKLLFSSLSGIYSACNVLTYILFFINVLFYLAMFIGTLILLTSYSSPVEIVFSGFTLSLVLLIAGITVYKFSSQLTGCCLMLISTVTKYFSIYTGSNSNPFNLSVTNAAASQLGTPKAQFFMHFIPQICLFAVCLYIIITLIREKALLKKMYNQICNKIYSLKSEDDLNFTSEDEWSKYIDSYLSGEYKNFKHPKKSIKKRIEKENKE